MKDKDRENVMETVMELSGARQTVDDALKVWFHTKGTAARVFSKISEQIKENQAVETKESSQDQMTEASSYPPDHPAFVAFSCRYIPLRARSLSRIFKIMFSTRKPTKQMVKWVLDAEKDESLRNGGRIERSNTKNCRLLQRSWRCKGFYHIFIYFFLVLHKETKEGNEKKRIHLHGRKANRRHVSETRLHRQFYDKIWNLGIKERKDNSFDVDEYKGLSRKEKEDSLWLRIAEIAMNSTVELGILLN